MDFYFDFDFDSDNQEMEFCTYSSFSTYYIGLVRHFCIKGVVNIPDILDIIDIRESKALIKVQNLQYTFLDLKRPPLLWNFSKNSSILVLSPVPKGHYKNIL